MHLPLNKYTCNDCNFVFIAPVLPDMSYGLFILWSSNGQFVYMNSFEDQVYSEFSNLLSNNFLELNNDKSKHAKILQKEFGALACDLDNLGAHYDMNGHPTCPNCYQSDAQSCEIIIPANLTDIDIPNVTHGLWHQKTDLEKQQIIKSISIE